MSGRRALIIGIDSYAVKPLRFCVQDAQEMAAVLSMPEFGFDVEILLDSLASRRELLKRLNELFASDADILLYFAGHGVATQFGAFLVSVDGDSIEPGVSLDYLSNLLNASADRMAAVFLDCCHAGAAELRSLDLEVHARDMTRTDVMRSVRAVGPTKALLAACQSHEAAQESVALHHGVFTAHLLDALCGSGADEQGDVTVSAIYDYIARRFEAASGQTPVFRSNLAGRLVLGRGLPARDASKFTLEDTIRSEFQAEQAVNEYVALTAMDVQLWLKSGYSDAATRLEPILRWMRAKATDDVRLRARQRFADALATANTKLAQLGDLIEGTVTPVGEVAERLGAGMFGTVWRVNDSQGTAAYKVYHPIDLGNYDKRARFDRGFRAMKQLNHPQIVRVLQLTECPVGFTMEYVNGPNARELVTRYLGTSEALRHLITIAGALQHAHERGVIHRDVKPENIIMRWDEDENINTPVLTDFDLAWFSTATQFTRDGIGSLIYAAPEQIETPSAPAAHQLTTDVYAFGQLMFFFLCGRDPAPRTSDNSAVLKRQLGDVSGTVAERLVSLYERSTRDAPPSRPRDMNVMAEMLCELRDLVDVPSMYVEIDPSRVLRELVTTIVGMDSERRLSPLSFATASGKTQVDLALVGDTTRLRITLQRKAATQSAEARLQTLNRLEAEFARNKHVTVLTGQLNSGQYAIRVDEPPRTLASVDHYSDLVRRAISSVEGHS
jgi:serine/threonine protein kinase